MNCFYIDYREVYKIQDMLWNRMLQWLGMWAIDKSIMNVYWNVAQNCNQTGMIPQKRTFEMLPIFPNMFSCYFLFSRNVGIESSTLYTSISIFLLYCMYHLSGLKFKAILYRAKFNGIFYLVLFSLSDNWKRIPEEIPYVGNE